jgi:large subunit ribosomal protein L23
VEASRLWERSRSFCKFGKHSWIAIAPFLLFSANQTFPRPNFTLTLLRTPKNPPTFASFIVPLNLNKLDLRDYLYNGYGVTVQGVRSYILQQKIRQDKPGSKRPAPRKWFRPRSIKKMMVEMDKPFVWPEEPVNFDEYVVLYLSYFFLQ